MAKESKHFNQGDFVFAKMKGYPAWPAQIINYEKKKYVVYFYGTGDIGYMKVTDLFQYLQCKEKLVTEKTMKRKSFRKAVEQIEAALNGEDIAHKLFLGILNINTLSHITADTLTPSRASEDKSVQTPINNFVDEITSPEDIPADVREITSIAKERSEEEAQNRVVMSPPSSAAVDEQSIFEPFFESVIEEEEEDYLFHEHKLVQLTQDIKDCLGLKSADVDRCLEILTEYKDLQLNKLMLLRNPECVNTIRVLQKYRGNLKYWNLTAEEEDIFNAKAEIICNECILIYNSFKSIFEPRCNPFFWQEFCEHVEAYNKTIKHANGENHYDGKDLSCAIYEKQTDCELVEVVSIVLK
uniref:PWWP domain-containing protein n=1 Tax=Glossina austeni TaxID=7395 RepID=A0A1A9VDF2_GLOAU